MKIWSDHNALGSTFSIDIFLDTNILEYLFSDQYPSLTAIIQALNEYPDFIVLKVSRYTIFEFFEIRKRNIYESILESKNVSNLKPQDIKEFNCKEVDFLTECVPVFQSILNSILELLDKFNVEQVGEIHNDLWANTFGIIANSKLSREDSLITTSALRPDIYGEPSFLGIITNDKQFNLSFHEESVESFFVKESLIKPIVWYIRCNDSLETCFGGKNITEELSQDEIQDYTNKIIFKFLKEKNKNYFVGETLQYIGNPSELVCMSVNGSAEIESNSRLLIVSKLLDFIILFHNNIQEFRNINGKILEFPIDESVDRVSFLLPQFSIDSIQIDNQEEIITLLRQSGHFVFIMPNIF